MSTRPATAHAASRAACLGGPGEMATLMRSIDWAGTPLGAVEGWPVSLCTAVRILLGSHQGMWLVWGPRQVFLYNDAWRAMTMAERHPGALGRPAAEVWADEWPAVQERIAPVLATGSAVFDEELMLLMQRGDHLEETCHTVSYCPVPDDEGAIGGLLCIGVDDTARVLQERRLRCLRETAAVVATPQPEDAMAATLRGVLGRCARDLPFTLAYLFDDHGAARLMCASGIPRGHPAAPESIAPGVAVPWPADAVRHGGTLVLHDLAGLGELPRGDWDRPPTAAALVSHAPSWLQEAAGFLVVGLHPYLPWDASYQEFAQQLADRVCAGLAVARSFAIANTSSQAVVAAERPARRQQRRALRAARAEVDDMRRSVERLRVLAHTLAGSSPPGEDSGEPAQESVTLASYTAELASLFRDAIETPDLRLVVDCPPSAERVDVDPVLWEKLVVQLLSNARESTCAGAITVGLRRVGRDIELTVADTGGVPAHKVPQVRELARLLGASVRVNGGEGRGSRFTVVLSPDHMPADDAAAAARRSAAPQPPAAAARILVADDDPHMRRHLRRLLGAHYHVQVFAVATAALAAARAMVPDLVLVDALLPDLDGAAFSRVLRADARTQRVPVILLTAPTRQSAVSGDSGGLERLVKPFTAQDLLARVAARLELARLQREAVAREAELSATLASEERFRRYFDLGLIGMALTSPTKGCIEANDELCRILGYSREELTHLRWPQLTHPDDVAADVAQFDKVVAGQQDGYVIEKRFIRKDGQAVWCAMAAQCVRAADGSAEFFVALVQDMTERLQTDEALRRAREQLAHVSRVAAMGELVASIAHEISQPLAAIAAGGQAAARWLSAQPPNQGEAVAAVRRIVAEAHRASEVIAALRRFLRRSEAQRAPVDLHACVSEVARMLEPEARARHVRVQVEPPRGEAIFVPGDAVQLQQVILNLAMNGFEAMAATLEAKRCLRFTVGVEGPHAVRVDVCDAGEGVAQLERDRIFDAFQTTRPNGMGLGLAISRSIVEAHGGRLWCTPNAGGGETFSFVLPA